MAYQLNLDQPIDNYRRLANGAVYLIRPSGADDRALLTRCFEGLSPASRRMRFFTHKHTLTSEDLDVFSGADGHDHIAFAAVRIDETGRELEPLGFARCMRLTPGSEVAELSITTVDRVQGQGVGAALLARLIEAAQAEGIRRFWFEVLAENAGMRRLAHRLGGEPQWMGSGIVEYDCVLPESIPAIPVPLETRPVPGLATGEPVREAPWYLDPVAWMEPWTETWVANLDRCLDWAQATNDELEALAGRRLGRGLGCADSL